MKHYKKKQQVLSKPTFDITPDKVVKDWFERLQIPRKEIGGFPICPYSKQVKNIDLETVSFANLVPPPIEQVNKIKVYHIIDDVTPEFLDQQCEVLSKNHPEFIFLGDHKDRNTYINGVQTNNGHYNFVLCQPKQELREARKRLFKTNYYKHWDDEYLKTILGDDYRSID